MPHISAAMERSLRRGVLDVVQDSFFGKRQTIPDRVESVKNTFSSWDGCMAKTYCKWPVIAGIIVGGLILFSVIACMIRCCCCGMSCCCTCFSFLKCCDCCGGACDGKKDKPHKHLDDPHAHHNYTTPKFAPTSGYQAPSSMPMMGGALAAKPAPQYAQFEVGSSGLAVAPKPLSEDALPPMPSWETAAKKHVETEEDKNAVELSNLTPTNGQTVPLMAGGVAAGNSMPASPNFDPNPNAYGGRGQGNGGYMGVGAVDQYGQSQSSFNTGYGAQTTGSTRGYASPPPQDSYGQNTNFVAAAVPGGYQRPQRQNTGERQYQNQNMDQYPPQGNQYSGNPRQMDRQYSDHPESYNEAPRGPSRGPGRMASPPNNQAYSRPAPNQQPSYNSARSQQTNDSYYNNSTAAPSYASRSPPMQEPSYQSYQAPSNNGRAPGRDPRQQPQGWDPVNR